MESIDLQRSDANRSHEPEAGGRGAAFQGRARLAPAVERAALEGRAPDRRFMGSQIEVFLVLTGESQERHSPDCLYCCRRMKSIMDMGAMRLDAQIIPVGEALALPWDLREWFAPEVLRQWIAEEIDSLDWSNPQLVEHLRGRPGFQPKPLFSLLVYAYTTAAFESEEIVRRFCAEEEYRSIGGPNARWDARTFTRFRRENRGLLKWALVQIFKRAIRAKRGDLLLPAGVKRRLIGAAVTRLDLARQMDRGHDGL